MINGNEVGRGFSGAHWLIASGWHTDLRSLRKHGYRLLSAKDTYRKVRCNTPSVEIPYLDLKGQEIGSRFRLADPRTSPDGKRKYTGRKGDPVALFLPPGLKWRRIAEDCSRPIYIAEGEAKAQYLADRFGLAAIGAQGCWAWQAQGKPAGQFAWITWKGRRVILIPDSDFRRNPDVRRGFAKLGRFLRDELKARVSVLLVPDHPAHFKKEPGAKYKTGVDDWCHVEEADLEAFGELRRRVTLPFDHPEVQQWDGSEDAQLPNALRGLAPVQRSWLDERPPLIEYVVAPYWQQGETATAVGAASVGKTYFLLPMCISIATGVPFFGCPVDHKRRAMYVLAERGVNSARRRFHKIVHAMAGGIVADEKREQFLADVEANVYIQVISGDTFNLIEQCGGQWQVSRAVDAFIGELKAAGIEVLFLDPLSRLHGGDEDNAVFSAITKAAERVVQAGISVMIAHHTGKNVRGDMYSGRGGSAFNDNTSETIVLTNVSEEDRRDLNLSALRPEDFGADLIRVHHARCSDGAPAPDMYLVRSRETGLLRQAKVDRKTPNDVLAGHLDDIRRWAAKRNDERFSASQFCRAEDGFARAFNIAKNKASGLLDQAVRAGVIRDTGEARNGGNLYVLNDGPEMPKLPGNSRATRASRGHLKKVAA
jgi:hypothetical protein